MPLRIVTSRGRRYVQRVRYSWDSVRGRAVTSLLDHLGPYDLVVKSHPELRGEIEALTQRGTPSPLPATRRRTPQRTRAALAPRLPAWTPPEEFLERVRKLVGRTRRSVSRAEVQAMAASDRVELSGSRWDLETSVGMVLTVLHRRGDLSRSGRGVRGDPYKYSQVSSEG